jgi:ABC-type sugar transport system substrate-binding protein
MSKKSLMGFSILMMLALLATMTSCSTAPAATEAAAPVEEATAVEAAPADAAPAASEIKVGLAAASAGWPWYATFINTLQTRADAAGWTLSVLGADGDVTTQINNIQDLIAAGVNYLVVGPVDGLAIVPALKDASDAGINVIIIGNSIDESGNDYVKAVRVPDDYKMGKDSAELMVEALNGSGKIFVVEGLPASRQLSPAFRPIKMFLPIPESKLSTVNLPTGIPPKPSKSPKTC